MNPSPALMSPPPTASLGGATTAADRMPGTSRGDGAFGDELQRQLHGRPGAAPPIAAPGPGVQGTGEGAAIGTEGSANTGNGLPGDGSPLPQSPPTEAAAPPPGSVFANRMAGFMNHIAPGALPGPLSPADAGAGSPVEALSRFDATPTQTILDQDDVLEEDAAGAAVDPQNPGILDLLAQGQALHERVTPSAEAMPHAGMDARTADPLGLIDPAEPGERGPALADDARLSHPGESFGRDPRLLADLGILSAEGASGDTQSSAEKAPSGMDLLDRSAGTSALPAAAALAGTDVPRADLATPMGPTSLPVGDTRGPSTAEPASVLAASVGTAAWFDELDSGVRWQVGQGQEEAHMRLNPADLGMLEVQVRVTERGTEVHFVAPHPQVREALEQGLARLRESLEGQGLQLTDASVSDGRTREDRQQGRAEDRGRFSHGGWAADDGTEVDLSLSHRSGRGLIDLYA